MIEIYDSDRYKIPAKINNMDDQDYPDWCDDYFCIKDQLYAQMMGWA